MSTPGFKFIDLPTAAERLGTTRNGLLKWVEEGRIKPFSGSGQQSVFRTSEVERLAKEMALLPQEPQDDQTAAPAEAQPAATGEAFERKRTRRRDAIKLMGTRLSMDSRWAEISDADISTWLDALEPVQYERVRKVANLAIERLNRVLDLMDLFEEHSAALNRPPSDDQELMMSDG